MTIGQALKRKRKELGLSQEQMAAGVISRAQYGKIEKDQHDISFSSLLSLLRTHNVEILNFINQIDPQLAFCHRLDDSVLSRKFNEAFYANDLATIQSLQKDLLSCENEELKIRFLLAKATLEGSFYEIDSRVGKKIREYIFSNENWTSDVIALRYFGSSMPLLPRSYLDLHMKQLLKKYAILSNYPLEMQERICAICGNYIFNVYTSYDKDIFNHIFQVIKSASNHPHLWEYKVIIHYFHCYIAKDKSKCASIITLLQVTNDNHVLKKLPILK